MSSDGLSISPSCCAGAIFFCRSYWPGWKDWSSYYLFDSLRLGCLLRSQTGYYPFRLYITLLFVLQAFSASTECEGLLIVGLKAFDDHGTNTNMVICCSIDALHCTCLSQLSSSQ